MHCINYAKREQEKPLLLKLTLRLRSTLSQAQSAACQELLVVFGLLTLNSNRTNHKPRKKLANQKRRHMSFRLCGIRTRYCALIHRRCIQKVQSVCNAGNKQRKRQEIELAKLRYVSVILSHWRVSAFYFHNMNQPMNTFLSFFIGLKNN